MISKKVTSKTKGDKSKTKRSRSVAARTSGLNSSFDPDAEPEEEEKPTLAYKILNAEQTKELLEIDDVDQLEVKVADVMFISDYQTDLKAATVLDYYVAALWWGKEQNFNVEQLSSFFTVVHTLLENIKEKTLTLLDNMKEFKRMLAGIGVPPPPALPPPQQEIESVQTVAETQSVVEVTPQLPQVPVTVLDCFSVPQAKVMSDYIHNSVFKHYKLYEYMFSHTQAEELIGADLEVEVPKAADMPWPPPLEEGLSGDIYHTYIDIPPPESSSLQIAVPGGESDTSYGDHVPVAMDPSVEVIGDILSKLSAVQIQTIMNSVFEDMLGDVKEDIANKLREKENSFIARINKVHQVQSPDKA